MSALEPSRLVGHRGAAAHAPENTLGGFARAVELGCSRVEFDVRLSRDGVPVLMHDDRLTRTTGLDMAVADLHSRHIAGLDAGSWFGPDWSDEKVPTLSQALDACAALGLAANVEVKAKAGSARRSARSVAALVAGRWPRGRRLPVVSSFDLATLYHLRFAGPDLPLALLMARRPVRLWPWHARLLRCRSVHIDRTLAGERLIGRAHARGLEVGVFTVNEREEASRLLARGADYLFSDRPDGLLG